MDNYALYFYEKFIQDQKMCSYYYCKIAHEIMLIYSCIEFFNQNLSNFHSVSNLKSSDLISWHFSLWSLDFFFCRNIIMR